MLAVSATGLSKVYAAGNKAVDNLNLTLGKGEIFGFLGPNGAGKTTTVKLLFGVLAPTDGESSVLGINPAKEPARLHKSVGMLTEHAQMYDQLTGLDNLIFYGSLFGLDKANSKRRAEALLHSLSLEDAKDRKLGAYSTGMRQRLSFARALIHKPALLFLDEPTSGLDPESAQSVNDTLRQMAADEQTTIFLCTHQLRYAEELCTSYGLIDEGVLFASGSLADLRQTVRPGLAVRVRCEGMPESLSARRMTDDGAYEIDVASPADIPGIVDSLVHAGARIYHIAEHHLSLEEVYFALLAAHKVKRGDRA